MLTDYWQDLYSATYQKQDRKIKGDDWFDYRLENDPKFLTRITGARIFIFSIKFFLPEESKFILVLIEKIDLFS
jgi:hypothetical protein